MDISLRVITPIGPKTHDIKGYSEKKLRMDIERDAVSGALRTDIRRIIPEESPKCV